MTVTEFLKLFPNAELWMRIGFSILVLFLGWILGRFVARLFVRLLGKTPLDNKVASWLGHPDTGLLHAGLTSLTRLVFFALGLWIGWSIIYPIDAVHNFAGMAGVWLQEFIQFPVVLFLFDLALVAFATFLLVRVVGWIRTAFERLARRIESQRGQRIRTISFQNLQLLSADQLTNVALGVNRYSRYLVNILLFLIYITTVFSIFPQTRGLVTSILDSILQSMKTGWQSFVSYLPSLLNLIIIIVATHYLLKLLHFFFQEIGKGSITFEGFKQDWAEPTYQLVRFLVIALALVVAFPYLPGSTSPAFQGVTIFLGALVSLGSSSVVANIVAGIVLTYTGAFKVGDRVKIAETVGDVTEKTLLVTRVRTIKNVDITIPNGLVLGSHIINYSSVAQQHGLILNTTITLGYDLSWRLVHETLIKAAAATADILPEPKPFVLQTSLDDSYVSYEINAYTDQPNKMAVIYSELHQNIQDFCNEAGIEILSPHYRAVRDGGQSTIPAEFLPKDYQSPPFQVNVRKRK